MVFFERRLFLALAAVGLMAIGATGVTLVGQRAFAGGGNGSCVVEAGDGSDEDGHDGASECKVLSGTLDDGAELLPLAGITLEQAIAAAQGAAQGSVGEVDLEYHKGRLVFNVDIGKDDVKVDAATGAIVSIAKD